MNNYTFTIRQQKYRTWLPKLEHRFVRLQSPKKVEKYYSPPNRNKSIQNDGKLSVGCHEILKSGMNEDFVVEEKREEKKSGVGNGEGKKGVERKNNLVVEMESIIGGYRVLNYIDKGGFAEVVEVKDEQGNSFAMKKYMLHNSMQCYKNQCMVGQHFFLDGALKQKYISVLGSKNIIKYIKKFKIGRKGYIIEQLGGKSLTKMISQIHGIFYKGQRIYEIIFTKFYKELARGTNFRNILLQIAYFIKLLNSQGFIHCDLKPQNILIDISDEGHPVCKIIDFGSTFHFRDGLPKTITPEYMPPQLLVSLDSNSNCQLNANLQKIDIWSLGAIMLEVMTGIPLWFRYRCKLQINNRQNINFSVFALSNREYRKIIKKQREICQNIKKINFVYSQFQKFRKILGRIFVMEEKARATIEEIIQMLEEIR